MRNAMMALGLGLCMTAGCAASVSQREDGGADPDVRASPDAPPDGALMPAPTAAPTMAPPMPATCMRTSGGVRVSVTEEGVTRGPCEGLSPGPPAEPTEVRGHVVRVTPTEVHVDSCHPDANCIPRVTVFAIEAGGASLDAFLRAGEYVTVRFVQNRNFRCTQAIQIRQLPEWGPTQNPAGPGRRLRFAAAEGMTGSAVSGEMELSIDRRLACPAPPGGPPSCGPVEVGEYDLVFLPINGTPEAVVPMGSAREFLLGTGAEQQTVRGVNLRSFETGACDDYWNYAWWVGAVR